MKTKHFAVIALLLVRPALAEPSTHTQHAAGHGQAATSASSTTEPAAVPGHLPPAPSRSVGEFVERTVIVARQQAEDEVHYETRLQVNKVFSRLLGR